MVEGDDLLHLYTAIGYVQVKWSFVESALDISTSVIYTHCDGSTLRKRMPKFLKDKCRFLVEASNKIASVRPFSSRIGSVTGRAIQLKDIRENLVHGTLAATTHENGVYSFNRLDAKDHHHEVEVYRFDIKNFPAIAERLETLAHDAQLLAADLEQSFPKNAAATA